MNKGSTEALEARVKTYWTQRAHDFGAVRKNELGNAMRTRWQEELVRHFPAARPLEILDVGTGTGFFAILLAEAGYCVQGIDLTPAMLDEGTALAAERGLTVTFRQMDAQKLLYDDASFDVIISRNLTWTLPDPAAAYAEWHRVLRPDGILLNYDANYGDYVRSTSQQNLSVPADSPYGHVGITRELAQESDDITLAMEISHEKRPEWDLKLLEKIGFRNCGADLQTGQRILGELDLKAAPMFGIFAIK